MTQINNNINNRNQWNTIKKRMQLNILNKKDIIMSFLKRKKNLKSEKNMRNKGVLFKKNITILLSKKGRRNNTSKDMKNTMKKELPKYVNKRMYQAVFMKILMNKKNLRVFSLYKNRHLLQGRSFYNYQPKMKSQQRILRSQKNRQKNQLSNSNKKLRFNYRKRMN